ncbi:hypothetical protein E4T44_00485 [Aureobasidium sp. EXF-8845]|nr:hypothetical protein E4T44_00485 [Aureobasidium sp. EXF-8845]KAI4857949.1 hypothetical protein E4T45_00541 [Aureobasidium sp. EXF-8846]
MLTFAACSSLLVSLAAAAAIRDAQQPLLEVAAVQMIDLKNQTAFKRLAIEDMSNAKFRVHHHAVKALLGDQSYITLRKAEVQQREAEIWTYLWNYDLDCDSWQDEEDDEDKYQSQPRIWMSDGRVFEADPALVPQDVINTLHNLTESEREYRRERRHQQYCEVQQNKTAQEESSEESGLELITKGSGPEWKAKVPEEYLRYLISESTLEEEDRIWQEVWKAKEEKKKQEILAGRRSVRDMKLPNLSKCVKYDVQAWDGDY